MSTTIIPEDLFGLLITPLSRFEQIAILQPNEYSKVLNKSEHQVIAGKILCEYPDNWDYGSSLSASVTCQMCRSLWSFRVNAESYREKTKEIKSPWTKLLDRASCHCDSCIILQRQFFLG